MAKKSPRKKATSQKSAPARRRSTAGAKSPAKRGVSKESPALSFPMGSSRLAFWKYNMKTGKVLWSGNTHMVFGVAQKSLPGNVDEVLAIVHKDDRDRFVDAVSVSKKYNRELFVDSRVVSPDGSYRWIEFSGQFSNRRGSVILEGLIQDVTIKKLTEFELVDWKTRNDLVSESAGLLIYDYDIATGEIIWSGNTRQLVGFTSLEMGRIELWEELIHPDDRDEANRLLDRSRKELTPYDVYYRFRKKDGGYCYIHDRGQFVPDNSGQAVRMLGVMNDVSERVSAELTIKQSEKSYRELFNSVGEAILIQRPDGAFLDVNKGVCDIYGYSKEELIGKTPGFLSAPGKNDFDELRAKMDKALHGIPQSFQWWAKKKTGEIFIMEVKLTRGTYFGEEIIIATSWDITEKIAAERSLQESEKRFRRLVQDLNVGVILQEPDGTIQLANRAVLRLLGVSEDCLLYKKLSHTDWKLVTDEGGELTHDDQPWVIAARTRKAVRASVVGLERQDDKAQIWALVNAEPILLENEKLLHIVVSFTDITERRKVLEDLKESELRFRTLQEASFGGIGLHSKGKIIDCNQGLCDITGYTYDELIGSNGLDLIAPEYRDFVLQQIVNKVEEPYDVEGIRKDGTRFNLEIHGKNIPYKEGLIRVTEFRDITDRKATEWKILEQNARLVAITDDLKLRNEQLQEFTQIVSHNLRSPVGNILSLLNFIENAEDERERNEYITLLKEAGTTTLTTLHELNDVLQIKQNKNIEKQRLDFQQVFANVRRMLVGKIVETEAEITTDFSEAPVIDYPNIYLESILLNLLSNALKYHHPERKPVIALKTFEKQGIISLSIADNGQGINMQRYGHQIFKLRKTFHKHPESRGIGLFMIKSQIDAMGGEISVSSIENEGTTFLIHFNSKMREDGY